MKPTLRKRASKDWKNHGQLNFQFLGMAEFCLYLERHFRENDTEHRLLEIGSHMGEGLAMMASTGIFSKIDVIEPFSGEEPFNKKYDWDWSEVRLEWQRNTKHFEDIIKLWRGYSYDLHQNFMSESFDLVYIDAAHDFDSVNEDIKQYLPKIKPGGIIAGHDYHHVWPGVQEAVRKNLGEPDEVFRDTTWLKIIK